MTYSDFDIEGVLEGRGQQMVKCPKCSWDRKKKNLKTLSVNTDKKVWNCHHCGWKGGLFDMEPQKEQKVYVKPTYTKTELSEQTVQYFLARGISSFVVNRNKITESVESILQKESGTFKPRKCINFNYFREGELINTQFRDRDKNFKLTKDAELIPYGLDDIKGLTEFLICEGQFDKLAWEEAGFPNCISVPNGATLKSNNLKWVDNSWEYFSKAEKIYLATDGDAAGLSLRSDLGHRLDVKKCWTIEYPENCKDANEVLQNPLYGKEYLKQMIRSAKPWPLQGLVDVDTAAEDFLLFYSSKQKEGIKLGMGNLDYFLTLRTGLLVVITGYSSTGKSEFMDEIYMRLAVLHEWKFGIFSPENWPIRYHIKKLIEKYNGEGFKEVNIEDSNIATALDFVLTHFYFLEDQDNDINLSLDGLLLFVTDLILRYGITAFVIDPWNFIEHQMEKGESETLYVSAALSKLTKFAKKNNLTIFLVAHPTKPMKTANGKYVPATLYDIAGSANFANKCDIGISIYREPKPQTDEEEWVNDDLNQTSVFIQKVRFKELGHLGRIKFFYNESNGLYSTNNQKPIGLRYLTQKQINYRDISESQNPPF